MSDKKSYYHFTTPLAPARYPKLHKQDVYDGKEVGYKCAINLEGEALAKVRKEIDEAIAKVAPGGKLKKDKKTPLRETDDGQFYLEAKSYNKVPLFKKNGEDEYPTSVVLGSGSTIRMKLSLTIGNGHLVAYINSVQVAKLIEGNKDGFDSIDDDESDDASDDNSDDEAGSGDDLDI